jgi:hypothetical protein
LDDIPKKTVPNVSAPIVIRTVTVTPTSEPELAYALNDLEFNVLLRGEQASGDQDLRAAACGVFATAFAGLIGIYFTVPMADIIKRGTTAIMLFYGLCALLLVSLVIIILTTIRLRVIRRDPVYRDLTAKIRRTLNP